MPDSYQCNAYAPAARESALAKATNQENFTTMIRQLLAVLISLFLLQHGALAAKLTGQSSFAAALRETPIGADPVQAYFLVGLLKDTGATDDDVDALRRELLHRYAEQLGGSAAAQLPKNSVAAAIEQGKSRPDVLYPEFVATWQSAYAKGLEVRWPDADSATPYFSVINRYMRPVAPGLWATESSTGQTEFMLSLRLVNKSALPLPIHRPDMVWGGDAGTGRGGLTFSCNWDGVPPPEGNIKADEVLMLEPGAQTRPLVCEAAPVGTYWKERLPSMIVAAKKGVETPKIISHEFDSRKRLNHLEWALGTVTAQSGDWRKRYQVSLEEVGRRWKPALTPLGAPIVQKWTLSPNDGWPAVREKMKWYLGATLVALALFGIGRGLLRAGVPPFAVGIGTLATLSALFASGMVRFGLTGGSGYDSPIFTGLALFAVVIGPMGFGIGALHVLHQLLDAEDLTWWQTVARGWLRAADMHSHTSRAEFWGFFAQLVWWWGLFNVCLKPLHLWLGGIPLYPLITLVVRRFRSMTAAEIGSVAVTMVCLVLLALA